MLGLNTLKKQNLKTSKFRHRKQIKKMHTAQAFENNGILEKITDGANRRYDTNLVDDANISSWNQNVLSMDKTT